MVPESYSANLLAAGSRMGPLRRIQDHAPPATDMRKLERLDAFLESRDLGAVWLAQPNSFAWLAGGSSVVDRERPLGVGALGYDGESITLLANNIELERLRVEELPDLEDADVPIETRSFPWHASSLREAIAGVVDDSDSSLGGPAAADVEIPGLETFDPATVRQPLTDRDRERYRRLGRETAAAVEAVCRELESTDTEAEVRAALTVSLAARNIETPVVLVGGAERVSAYRHFTPKPVEFGAYAIVSVTTERHGLHASCTRTVAFDAPTWLEDRHEMAMRVETTALAGTQAGTRAPDAIVGDVFGAIQGAYAALGQDDEWREHHQGGAAGFAGREWIATPDHAASLRAPMAYAWNPTVQGAKSEDTVLVTEDEFETLTSTGEWPTVSVRSVPGSDGSVATTDAANGEQDTTGGLEVPDLELERHGVLGIHGD